MKIDEERMFGKPAARNDTEDVAAAADFDDQLRRALGRGSTTAAPAQSEEASPPATFDQGARGGSTGRPPQSADDVLREARKDMRLEPPDAVNRYMRRL